jgi:hypothetical protein
MLNLKNGYATFRYWGEFNKTLLARETKADRTVLLEALRRARPDIDGVMANLERDGVAVIENYWPEEKCVQASADIERFIVDYADTVQRFSNGSDKRIFGSEAQSVAIAQFHYDPFLQWIGEYLGGYSLYNFSTLAARIDASETNNGSGDGWHRDAHGFQYKSILYLSDVDETNGPFEYVLGSQKRLRATFEAMVGGVPAAPNTRYEAALIGQLMAKYGFKSKRFTGKQGTLLLVNTAGLHRGAPLLAGERYALTNYFYHPHQIDESRLESFPKMLPGAADRVRADLLAG